MIEQILFIMILAVALLIILIHDLKHVIVGMGVLSLLATFCYLYYRAPDVAIAEAIIGCALTTILFIIAFKKHRTFYVYFTSESKSHTNKLRREKQTQDILSVISDYCRTHDLQLHCYYTFDSPDTIITEHVCDLILEHKDGAFNAHGIKTEQHANALRDILATGKHIAYVPQRGDDDES